MSNITIEAIIEDLEKLRLEVSNEVRSRVNMSSVLKSIVDDFDQTGCSEGVGVVRTSIINEARELLGMEPLVDEEGESEDESG